MELEELAARESIRDLVARYNQNGDAGRIDAMLALFEPDAVVSVRDRGTYAGIEAIRDLFSGTAESSRTTRRIRALRHFTATHQIDLEDRDTATGRAYYAVFTDRGLDHWGRYVDVYRRRDGRWRFAKRTVTIDGSVEGSWAEASGGE